jgi:hypothetical protein
VRGVREGLSRMRCKAHVRFLGEGVRATSPPYPTGPEGIRGLGVGIPREAPKR